MDWQHFGLVRVPVFQEEQTAPDKTVIKSAIDFVTLEQCLDALNIPYPMKSLPARASTLMIRPGSCGFSYIGCRPG